MARSATSSNRTGVVVSTMPRSRMAGQIAGLEADAVERANFELRHQFDMAPRQTRHAMPDRAANIGADFGESRERVRLGIDFMDDEAPLQLLQHEGLLSADQSQFDAGKGTGFGHDAPDRKCRL